MKKHFWSLILASAFFTIPWVVFGKAEKKTTKMNFNSLKIKGKYHYSYGLGLVVEDEKIIKEILPFRKDFKDRIRWMGELKK